MLVKTLVIHCTSPLAAFKKWFVLAFLCMFGFSICEIFWTPKVYSSTTRIQVQSFLPDAPEGGFGSKDPYFLTTQFKIIESYSLLTNVIATLHLDQKLARQSGETNWTMDQTYAALFDKISVQQTRMSSLIEISVKNPDPKLAADIANAIVDAYRAERLGKWKGDRVSGINALQAQLDDAETRQRMMETKLNEMPATSGISDLTQQVEALKRNNEQLIRTIEALKRNNEQLKRTIEREVAEASQPLEIFVVVRDPARAVLRPTESGLDIFSKWMFGGTLAALLAGGVGAWLTSLIRRRPHPPSAPS